MKQQFPFNGHAVCDLVTFWEMMARVVIGNREVADDDNNCVYHPGWAQNVRHAVESHEIAKLSLILRAMDPDCPFCGLAKVRELGVFIGDFGWRVEVSYENVTWTCLAESDCVNIEWTNDIRHQGEQWLEVLSAILFGATDIVSHDDDDDDVDVDEETIGM